MGQTAPHVLELEFRRLKRSARMVVLAVMALPLFYYGPLLWTDGSYNGRWDFVTDVSVRPAVCKGVPGILQACEVNYVDRLTRRSGKLEYLVANVDWNNVMPDIVRNSNGHHSSSMAVTTKGLLERLGALLILLFALIFAEKFFLMIVWKSKGGRQAPPGALSKLSKETVLLSRDRRDHI
jgi:hypothetical protein